MSNDIGSSEELRAEEDVEHGKSVETKFYRI